MMCSTLSMGVCCSCCNEACSNGISIDMFSPFTRAADRSCLYLRGQRNNDECLADGNFFSVLVLRPALDSEDYFVTPRRAFLERAEARERIAQAYHADIAYPEIRQARAVNVGDLLLEKLSEKGHA